MVIESNIVDSFGIIDILHCIVNHINYEDKKPRLTDIIFFNGKSGNEFPIKKRQLAGHCLFQKQPHKRNTPPGYC